MKQTTVSAGREAARFGKEAAQSDLAKDAGAGAAVGAVMAVPVPLIGPVVGATAGATLGIYKNLTRDASQPGTSASEPKTKANVPDELLKIEELRKKGIISGAEFSTIKKAF